MINMDDYSFFREQKEMFIPKTPVAALKAYETDFVPISVFINKSNSTKPLDEEPYDIEEIERLLSRENLGLQTNIILVGIFEKLIFSEDQEIALFAAESINIIENRYNKQIQDLKDDLEEKEDIDKYSELGTLYFELAILNRKRESIKNFYMRESYTAYNEVKKRRKMTDEELNQVIRILLELRKNQVASDLLDREHETRDVFYLKHKAEIEFSKKEFVKVKAICFELLDFIDELKESEYTMITYWMGA
ncbi:MAG: hypothetical protein JEY91_10750 [Spirochaetaceae bacterium]|nr:hypothetical protein [Spirochaetaceae bacterium]